MSNRPEVTEDDIRLAMDFDHVLKQTKTYGWHRIAFFKNLRIGVIITGIILLGTTAWWQMGDASKADARVSENAQKIPSQKNQEATPTPALKDSVVKIFPPQIKQAVVSDKKPTSTKGSKALPDITRPLSPVTTRAVFQEAEPKAGFPALYDYFSKELKYPAEGIKDSIQGIITVKFVINKKGLPEKIQILNSLGPAFDKEAVRLIGHMPEWKAATLDGEAVESKISMPLTFRVTRK